MKALGIRVAKGASQLRSRYFAGSEEDEDLSHVTFDVLGFLTDDVEAHSLGKGSALTNCDDVSDC